MSELTSTAIKKLKVAELKAELSKRGLPTKGKKDELASRLLEAAEGLAETDGEHVSVVADKDSSEIEIKDVNESKDSLNLSEVVDDHTEMEEEVKSGSSPKHVSTDEVEFMDTQQDSSEREEISQLQTEAAATSDSLNLQGNQTDVSADRDTLEEENGHSESAVDKEAVSIHEQEPSGIKDIEAEIDTKSIISNNVGGKDEMEVKDNGESKLNSEKKAEEDRTVIEPVINIELEENEHDECTIDGSKVILDSYTADLHFVGKPDGLTGRNLVKNDMSFLWCGVQANYGVQSGKICYECKIVKKLEVQLPDSEVPIYGVRIGWSAESSGLQLGEASLSYGYESSGKICASSNFSDYADPFGEGDIIGAYLDLESDPKTLKYTKNGQDLGIAMSLSVNLEGKALFPHFFIKNVEIEVNFGSRENPWHEMLDGYNFIQKCNALVLQKSIPSPVSKSDCEVIMMIGLPAAGKTTWAQNYCRENKDKHYYVIGSNLIMDRMKLQGQTRKKGSDSHQRLTEATQKILAKFLALAPLKKKNYILDQTNVVAKVQKLKMENFSDFKRKAVVVIPTYENLRKRTADKKQREGIDVPFEILASMKYFFTLPSEGELVEEVHFAEQDGIEAKRTVDGYHREGKRSRERGSDDPHYKRQRYEHDRRGPRHDTVHYGGRNYEDRRRYDRHGDNRRGVAGYRGDYGGRSYNSGSYGGGSYNTASYGGGYGGYSGQAYGSNSYGQRNSGYSGGSYGGGSYGSYGGQRGGYSGSFGGSSYGGGSSQRGGASGYKQNYPRDRSRQGGGGQYNQNYGTRGGGSQSSSYGGTGRGYVPRGGGWSQGYGTQQGYNSYQSGQSNFRGYGY